MRQWQWALLVLTGFLALSLGVDLRRAYSQQVVPVPEPAPDAHAKHELQTAVFAGGCFWGVEAVFEQLRGVSDVVSGYAGGGPAAAHYDIVSGGGTQHAEAVQITFDPAVVSYGQLLKVFFAVAHDPTQLNRQGPDRGFQYRSAIFYTNEVQRRAAEEYVQKLRDAKAFPRPIVTRVVPLPAFYRAEDYHQDYLRHHPYEPYIVVNDAPKVARLIEQWPDLIKRAN